jgi:hypothetical protein
MQGPEPGATVPVYDAVAADALNDDEVDASDKELLILDA